MDRIKLTLRRTDSTADTLILIHNRSSAAEAALCLCLDLLLGECAAQVAECLLCHAGFCARNLAFCVVKCLHVYVVLIQLDELSAVTSEC